MNSARRIRRFSRRELEQWCSEMAAAARANALGEVCEVTSFSADTSARAPLPESLATALESMPAIVQRVVPEAAARNDLAGGFERLRRHFRFCRRAEGGSSFFSLLYPLFALIGVYFIIMLCLVKVVPPFEEMFREFGSALPWPTEVVLFLSHFAINKGLFAPRGAFLVLALVVCLAIWFETDKPGLYFLDSAKLRMPLLGRRVYCLASARFSHAFSILMASGVAAADSLEAAALASGSTAFRNVTRVALHRLSAGDSLPRAIASSAFFDRAYCQLLETGARTMGEERAFAMLAEVYAGAASTRSHASHLGYTLYLIVPLMFLLGCIVLGLYIPIFTLGDAIAG